MNPPELISGSDFVDQRGRIRFFNELNLQEVVRFYEIEPKGIDEVRGWQGHRAENKWFYCLKGTFTINLTQPVNWDHPERTPPRFRFELKAEKPGVLWVPEGTFSGIKANEPSSRLMVFSNMALQESKNDDFRIPVDYWPFER